MAERRTRDGSQQSLLRTERGITTASGSVVSRVTGMAAREVEGVQMGGAARAVGEVVDSVAGSSGWTRGVSVEVGYEETAIDLDVSVDYGRAIPQISDTLRRNVVDRVENLAGLEVTQVNVRVNDVLVPQERPDQEPRS